MGCAQTKTPIRDVSPLEKCTHIPIIQIVFRDHVCGAEGRTEIFMCQGHVEPQWSCIHCAAIASE